VSFINFWIELIQRTASCIYSLSDILINQSSGWFEWQTNPACRIEEGEFSRVLFPENVINLAWEWQYTYYELCWDPDHFFIGI